MLTFRFGNELFDLPKGQEKACRFFFEFQSRLTPEVPPGSAHAVWGQGRVT